MAGQGWTYEEEALARKLISAGEKTSYISAMTGHSNVAVISLRTKVREDSRMKECRMCGQRLPAPEFAKGDNYCRACRNVLTMNKAKHLEANRRRKETRRCCMCGETLPISQFVNLRRTCRECERKKRIADLEKKRIREERKARLAESEKHYKELKEKREKTAVKELKKAIQSFKELCKEHSAEKVETIQQCKNCRWYPCFSGIDGMKTNLALTCRSWRLSERVKQ